MNIWCNYQQSRAMIIKTFKWLVGLLVSVFMGGRRTTPREKKEQPKKKSNPFDEMHIEQTYLRLERDELIDRRKGCGLDLVCSMHLKSGKGMFVISHGSIVDFSSPNPSRSAIVNAANEHCLGGGGVDGAISDAGGPRLLKDRRELPIDKNVYGAGIRCPTGQVRVTGPNKYGRLNVEYVIHAVGPNYFKVQRSRNAIDYADSMLRSAYTLSLEWAKYFKLEYVAFSLLSAGIFSGSRSKKGILEIAVRSILDFDPYDELKEIHICAYTDAETKLLQEIISEIIDGKENMYC